MAFASVLCPSRFVVPSRLALASFGVATTTFRLGSVRRTQWCAPPVILCVEVESTIGGGSRIVVLPQLEPVTSHACIVAPLLP